MLHIYKYISRCRIDRILGKKIEVTNGDKNMFYPPNVENEYSTVNLLTVSIKVGEFISAVPTCNKLF